MQSKLQPKDIARYVGYGLKISTGNIVRDMVFCPQQNLITVPIETVCSGVGHKPILFPCDNLTTPITVKGKTITPLLELAKIAQPNYEWRLNHNLYVSFNRNTFEYEDGSFFIMEGSYDYRMVYNQSALFDWMDEHFIDYRGLIPQSLAVDVTTLKDNPYAT